MFLCMAVSMDFSWAEKSISTNKTQSYSDRTESKPFPVILMRASGMDKCPPTDSPVSKITLSSVSAQIFLQPIN
ncbi:unnamed protein product [Larinioides sclopetarius]|uniref:Uncharacterized protein n=1 Tax=Larinioides sclopetarius TaxID=280406 RepID=A0AAV2BYI6_9ARAC